LEGKGRKEEIMKEKAVFFLSSLFFVLSLSGCAGSKIYLLDVRYLQEKKAPPSSALQAQRAVGICPFEDARKEKENIGVRYRSGGHVDLLRVEGITLSEAVTRAVRDYFKERGFKVVDCMGWDRRPEGLSRLRGELFFAVGGKIESFSVEATSGLTTTETKYRVRIEAMIGNVDKGEVMTRAIESTPQTKKMSFDPDEVRETINRTLTEVIQNLFRGTH